MFTEDGKYLIKCKNGCTPEECSYDPGNDRSVAYFQRSNCEECPYRKRCQLRFLKTRVRKEVSLKSVGRAKQLQYMLKQFHLFSAEDIMWIISLYTAKSVPDYSLDFKIAALDFQKLLDYISSLDSYASNEKTA